MRGHWVPTHEPNVRTAVGCILIICHTKAVSLINGHVAFCARGQKRSYVLRPRSGLTSPDQGPAVAVTLHFRVNGDRVELPKGFAGAVHVNPSPELVVPGAAVVCLGANPFLVPRMFAPYLETVWRDPDCSASGGSRLRHDAQFEDNFEEEAETASESLCRIRLFADRPTHHRFIDERPPEERGEVEKTICASHRDVDLRRIHCPPKATSRP
jgi:hypothetical protein